MYLLPKGNITCVNTKWGKDFTRLNGEKNSYSQYVYIMYIYAELFVLLLLSIFIIFTCCWHIISKRIANRNFRYGTYVHLLLPFVYRYIGKQTYIHTHTLGRRCKRSRLLNIWFHFLSMIQYFWDIMFCFFFPAHKEDTCVYMYTYGHLYMFVCMYVLVR